MSKKRIITISLAVITLIMAGTGIFIALSVTQTLEPAPVEASGCPFGQIFCAGCIGGCRPNSQTCNAWIDQECQQSSCCGNGVNCPTGQSCCGGLVKCNNNRCGTSCIAPTTTSAPPPPPVSECTNGQIRYLTQCGGDPCNAGQRRYQRCDNGRWSTAQCAAVSSCSVCTPGQTQTGACGQNGCSTTQQGSRTCGSNGQWSGWTCSSVTQCQPSTEPTDPVDLCQRFPSQGTCESGPQGGNCERCGGNSTDNQCTFWISNRCTQTCNQLLSGNGSCQAPIEYGGCRNGLAGGLTASSPGVIADNACESNYRNAAGCILCAGSGSANQDVTNVYGCTEGNLDPYSGEWARWSGGCQDTVLATFGGDVSCDTMNLSQYYGSVNNCGVIQCDSNGPSGATFRSGFVRSGCNYPTTPQNYTCIDSANICLGMAPGSTYTYQGQQGVCNQENGSTPNGNNQVECEYTPQGNSSSSSSSTTSNPSATSSSSTSSTQNVCTYLNEDNDTINVVRGVSEVGFSAQWTCGGVSQQGTMTLVLIQNGSTIAGPFDGTVNYNSGNGTCSIDFPDNIQIPASAQTGTILARQVRNGSTVTSPAACTHQMNVVDNTTYSCLDLVNDGPTVVTRGSDSVIGSAEWTCAGVTEQGTMRLALYQDGSQLGTPVDGTVSYDSSTGICSIDFADLPIPAGASNSTITIRQLRNGSQVTSPPECVEQVTVAAAGAYSCTDLVRTTGPSVVTPGATQVGYTATWTCGGVTEQGTMDIVLIQGGNTIAGPIDASNVTENNGVCTVEFPNITVPASANSGTITVRQIRNGNNVTTPTACVEQLTVPDYSCVDLQITSPAGATTNPTPPGTTYAVTTEWTCNGLDNDLNVGIFDGSNNLVSPVGDRISAEYTPPMNGGSGTCRYTFTVDSPGGLADGSYTIKNMLNGTAGTVVNTPTACTKPILNEAGAAAAPAITTVKSATVVAPTESNPNTTVNYTVTVRNIGTVATTVTTVRDDLPPEIDGSDTSQVTNISPAASSRTSDYIEWTLNTSLNPGQSTSLTYTVILTPAQVSALNGPLHNEVTTTYNPPTDDTYTFELDTPVTNLPNTGLFDAESWPLWAGLVLILMGILVNRYPYIMNGLGYEVSATGIGEQAGTGLASRVSEAMFSVRNAIFGRSREGFKEGVLHRQSRRNGKKKK